MTARQKKEKATTTTPAPYLGQPLLTELRDLIISARQQVAQTVNAGLTLLYWQVGNRIRRETLKEKRAEYGAEIVQSLSAQLELEFGRGFGRRNIFRMIRFAEVFPDSAIVTTLLTQLSWSHFLHIIRLDDPLKRDFYAELCRLENWDTRTLNRKIQSMLYERSALSRKPDELIEVELKELREEDKLTPALVFRDPYFLDFLGLKDSYAEKDLEAAILREMESFILELGVGFAFMERQKRITIDGIDHYLDLLFYHRNLGRLVAIELKIGEFRAAHKGQMELYLAWLNRYERKTGEESPLGLILCAGKKHETVELLDLERSGIQVSSYWTDALPKAEMERKLHEAVILARARLESGKNGEK
ncbi:MAG TPA: DUF1016 domain-containing protein [Desulfuromonadales bacterium]|nr:DUF1016 domain-containing protein [Desulfuromonadales bacterium]